AAADFTVETDVPVEGTDGLDTLDPAGDPDMDADVPDTADGGDCVTDQDCDNNEPCDGQETCSGGSCVAGTPLPDGGMCTFNVIVHGWCEDGVCIPVTCGDGMTDPGEECDDGNENPDDGCRPNCRYSCRLNAQCDDENDCTSDYCSTVGNLRMCASFNTHDPCDDDDACTREDKCQSGACSGGLSVSCNDRNPCTDDSCDPGSGCKNESNTAGCSDGNPCTSDDICGEGECRPGGHTCVCDPDPCDSHDDGNPCNGTLGCQETNCVLTPFEGCDGSGDTQCLKNTCVNTEPGAYVCEMLNAANGTACDDGDLCTQVDTCSEGMCAGGSELDCNDSDPCTDDLCTPASGCYHELNRSECSDGLFCTIRNVCNSAGECLGEPRPCFDGEECTADFCNEITDSCDFVDLPELTPCGSGGSYCCQEGNCLPCPSE
ncbi:MAG: hypothetical protein ABIJ56_03050, partial [Pseudomonadota bacterium]